MTPAKLKSRLQELEMLEQYQKRLKQALEAMLLSDHSAICSFKLVDNALDPTEVITTVKDRFGNVIDMEAFSDYPEAMRKNPFLIFPGCVVTKEPVNPPIAIDIELKAELLLVFFSYLLKKVEARIEIIKNYLQSNEKKS